MIGEVAECGFVWNGWGHFHALKNVGLCIVKSPCAVEPGIDPEQKFGYVQQCCAFFLFLVSDGIEGVDDEPCKA